MNETKQILAPAIRDTLIVRLRQLRDQVAEFEDYLGMTEPDQIESAALPPPTALAEPWDGDPSSVGRFLARGKKTPAQARLKADRRQRIGKLKGKLLTGAAIEVNPETGKPYKMSATARAKIAAAVRKRHRNQRKQTQEKT